MTGQVTCNGFRCGDSLRHRKDEEDAEDGNGGLGDDGDTQETVVTDVPINTSQSVN